MAKRNLHFGGTGAKVRPLTACKGTTCVYGNIDTQALAKVLFDRFYIGMGDVKLPHKFKIGVGGCPNSCMKPSLNDVGIEGCKAFSFDSEECRGCTTCAVEVHCPSKAVHTVNGKALIDADKCTACGVCIGKCPFAQCLRTHNRYVVFLSAEPGEKHREWEHRSAEFTLLRKFRNWSKR